MEPQVTTADFGEVLVGKSAEHILRFGNHSMVPANFTIVPEGQDQATDNVYTIQPARYGVACNQYSGQAILIAEAAYSVCSCNTLRDTLDSNKFSCLESYWLRGTLGPEEYSEMRVVYTPKHSGAFSCQNWVLSTAGGNRVVLNVSGQAVGPLVTFSSRCVSCLFFFGVILTHACVNVSGHAMGPLETFSSSCVKLLVHFWRLDACVNVPGQEVGPLATLSF
eukprot:1157841-Pelagomonas_calceolata.AAC.1